MRSLPSDDKLRLRSVIKSLKDICSRYWSGEASYEPLRQRLDETAQLLLEDGERKNYGKSNVHNMRQFLVVSRIAKAHIAHTVYKVHDYHSIYFGLFYIQFSKEVTRLFA